MTTQISKGERDELRRVVRGDFKALNSEIGVREAELRAEVEKRVALRYKAHEDAIAKAKTLIAEIVAETNGRIAEIMDGLRQECDGYEIHWRGLDSPTMHFVRERREELRRAMLADLDARVAQAKAQMQREEVTLLKKLSEGALESDAARAFLTEIPTVAALVPESRLAELEAQFDRGEIGGEEPPEDDIPWRRRL